MSARPPAGLDQRGVTLLEVMISMAVFTIGMLGLLRMHAAASQSNAYAMRLDRATRIGQELLEYLQHVPYDAAILDASGTKLSASDDLMDETGRFTAATLASSVYSFSDANLPDANNTSTGVDPCASVGTTCRFSGYYDPAIVTTPTPGRPSLDFNGDGQPDFQRYWIVREDADNSSGRPRGKHISVVVRWFEPGTGRWLRVVHYGYRVNRGAYLP